ncbi:MAG: hypothetical protein WCC72_12025 [Dehalococcoidales bacterium]|jgi:hypothetical protein
MFIRMKTIKGRSYYYLVENKRFGKKVKQRVVSYLGKSVPPGLSEEISRKPLLPVEKQKQNVPFVENEVIDKKQGIVAKLAGVFKIGHLSGPGKVL